MGLLEDLAGLLNPSGGGPQVAGLLGFPLQAFDQGIKSLLANTQNAGLVNTSGQLIGAPPPAPGNYAQAGLGQAQNDIGAFLSRITGLPPERFSGLISNPATQAGAGGLDAAGNFLAAPFQAGAGIQRGIEEGTIPTGASLSGEFRGSATDAINDAQAAYDNTSAGRLGIQSRFDPVYGAIRDRAVTGFESLLPMLEGAGAQERKDIRQDFANTRGAVQGDLSSRGLSGSSLVSGALGAVGRQESNALGGLNDRLINQRLNTKLAEIQGVAGAQTGAAGAQQGLAQYATEGNAGDLATLNANKWNLEQAPINFDQNRVNQLLGLLQGVNIQGPDPSTALNTASGIGAGLVQPVSPQGQSGALFGPALGGLFGGLGAGAGYGIASGGLGGALGPALALGATKAFVCIDAMAIVHTPLRPKNLRDIRVGDLVLNADNEYRVVVGVDCGLPKPSQVNNFIRITAPHGALVLTKDHPVSYGLPATIERAEPVECGDILLDDGSDYIANGFRVESLLTKEDIGKCRSTSATT